MSARPVEHGAGFAGGVRALGGLGGHFGASQQTVG
jgi:hypothetical protein